MTTLRQRESVPLPPDLVREIWLRISNKLNDGEVLLSNDDFRRAFEEIFSELTGGEPDVELSRQIESMISTVNRDHPETFLAQGVQNGISKAFEEGVRRLNWNAADVQSRGVRALQRFSKQDSVRDMLDEANIELGQIDPLGCVKQVVNGMVGTREDTPKSQVESPPRSWSISPEPTKAAAADTGDSSSVTDVDPEIQAAIDGGELDSQEVKRHLEQQEKRRSELEKSEREKVPENLQSFVDRGVVTEEEADQLRELDEVDKRVKNGEIDEDEASAIRNSILGKTARDKLERKVREGIADSVRYLQVFEGMQKINPKYHDAIGFLIEHKNAVIATESAGQDLAPVIKALMQDVDLLDLMIDVMERKDQEIRMLSVRLHPYSQIMGRGLERITNMIIEESFVEDLEKASFDDMSDRLNSDDQHARVRPAADMRCLISLVDHVTKKTRFRKELRLLRISKQLEEFYSSTSDLKEARHQAENFLNRRLRRMFPDMSTDEAAEIQQRSTEMMDQIEQRILDERQSAVEAERKKTEAAAANKPKETGGSDDEMELSEDEIAKGVQIGRVEMRVAGSTRRIPQKIMPDPDDPTQFVMVSRDPDTQELVPAKRRGQKRIVERGRDGSWQESKG